MKCYYCTSTVPLLIQQLVLLVADAFVHRRRVCVEFVFPASL